MERNDLRSPIGDAPVHHFREVDSTMTRAKELVASGAGTGTVVVADYQSAGRGRVAGRQWLSPPGESLMFTVALRMADPGGLPLRAGLAVSLALEDLCGLRPRVKWPNDILVGGRKICGILCEYAAPWLYVGVGLNVGQDGFPVGLRHPATSIVLEQQSRAFAAADRDRLLLRIVRGLGDDPGYPAGDWIGLLNDRLWGREQQVTLTTPDGRRVRGVLGHLAPDGVLVMIVEGAEMTFVAGELDATGKNTQSRREE